jgi:hypothetical protein
MQQRLSEIFDVHIRPEAQHLEMFFHKQTMYELSQLRAWLRKRLKSGAEDQVDKWIRMVATNRLTGHSPGFFSVYTLPPNQALSRERQKKINKLRSQKPEYRNVETLILKKSRSLQKGLSAGELQNLSRAASDALFLNTDASESKKIPGNSVQLTVTSPPFLDIVQYAKDNWLRCWFNDIDADKIGKKITMSKTVDEWKAKMNRVFKELYRITASNGIVAFEVGEVRKGKIRLEEYVLPIGEEAGFKAEYILINRQSFTKTANIWGVTNNVSGTNSHRIVVFQKHK